MTDTVKKLREILAEQFGPEREAALKDDAAPWWDAIGAKMIDRIDFSIYVRDTFAVSPPEIDRSSLTEIGAFIDATTPNTSPY